MEDKYIELYCDSPRRQTGLAPWMKTGLFIGVVWCIMNICTFIYMSQSRNIYFWDSATYWDISRGIASGNIKSGLTDIYRSISELDYNYVAALPSALWSWIFGDSRLVYVLGLVNMYIMPSFAMIYLLAEKMSKGSKVASVLTLLLFPAMVFMPFIGFADIGGLTPCLICMYLYFTGSPKRADTLRYIAIGILLVFTVLWRRWFAFFAVSFITAMIGDTLLFKRRYSQVITTAVTSGIILLLFFRGFVFDKLLANYSNLYSGYKFTLSTDIKLFMRYFGMLTIAVLAAGSIAAGIYRGEKRTVFLWLQILVCFIMFTVTQTHGQQHLILYIPSFIMLTLILIKYINKVWMLAVLALIGVMNSTNICIPREQPNNIQEIKHYALVPDFSMRPIKRKDVADILSLKGYLDNTIEDDKKLVVLASSFWLNEDILLNAEPSMGLKKKRPDYIAPLPQVDSRDDDFSALYNADYILAAFPAQTHLAPENQKIITEAVRSFEVYADIAKAYEEMPEHGTEFNGMTIKLFKRVSDVSETDISDFEKRVKGN